jgi:Domain of unknown function (DUF4331)
VSLCAGLFGCGDDTSLGGADAASDHTVVFEAANPTDTGNGAEAVDEAAVPPPPPALGTQVDRLGRPAINMMLVHTLDTNATTRGAAKDAYNADVATAHWATYVPELSASLAAYDALDGVCGNQPAFTPSVGYATLAGLLADDVLWVDTSSSTCMQYLAVEAPSLGQPASTDCGGRTLVENVMDSTYALVAGPAATVTNGTSSPSSAPGTTFPYLAAPH